MARRKPNVVLRRIVCNQSARDAGSALKLMVLHSTESDNRPGDSDLLAIANWFDNPAAQASAHVVVDGDGQSARCVEDDRKAWACAGYNSVSLNIEQVGRASQSDWSPMELRETARWLALWSLRHDIPLRRGRVLAGRVVRRGVVTHSQLGSYGGGHSDPGSHYPVKKVIELARRIKADLQKAA